MLFRSVSQSRYGGAINHPDAGKRFDISVDTGKHAGIDDASVFLYPSNGYGDAMFLKQIMQIEHQ